MIAITFKPKVTYLQSDSVTSSKNLDFKSIFAKIVEIFWCFKWVYLVINLIHLKVCETMNQRNRKIAKDCG